MSDTRACRACDDPSGRDARRCRRTAPASRTAYAMGCEWTGTHICGGACAGGNAERCAGTGEPLVSTYLSGAAFAGLSAASGRASVGRVRYGRFCRGKDTGNPYRVLSQPAHCEGMARGGRAGFAGNLGRHARGTGHTHFICAGRWKDHLSARFDSIAVPNGIRVGVADTRGELAAMRGGVPQFVLGGQCDVLDGCPKALAALQLVRTMAPQVLALDEVTDPQDLDAIRYAANCGVTVLATIHAADASELRRKPFFRALCESGAFTRLVTLTAGAEGRSCRITALEGGTESC